MSPVVTCAADGCDQQCIANETAGDHYCPECAKDIPMGTFASPEAHRATERRNRLRDGRASGDGRL